MRLAAIFLSCLIWLPSCLEDGSSCATPIPLGTFFLEDETIAYFSDRYEVAADIQFENEAGETVTFQQTNQSIGTFEDQIEEPCPEAPDQFQSLVFEMEDRFFFYEAKIDSITYNIAIGAAVLKAPWAGAQTSLSTIDRFVVNLTGDMVFIEDQNIGFYSSYRDIDDPDFQTTYENTEIVDLIDFTLLDETFPSLVANRDTNIFLAVNEGVVAFESIDGTLWKRKK